MALSLQEMEAWLPPELFSKDDIPLENQNLCFLPDFPFYHPSKNAYCAPERDKTEGLGEDDYSFLLALGRRPTRPPRLDDYPLRVKENISSGISPVSTLYGTSALWSSSNNGSPNGESTPTDIKANASDIIVAAADQVARIKLGYPPSTPAVRYQHCLQKLCPFAKHSQMSLPACAPVRYDIFNGRSESMFMPPAHTHVPNQTFRSYTPSARSVSVLAFPKRERSGTGVFLPRQYDSVPNAPAADLCRQANMEPDMRSVRRVVPRSHCDERQYELAGNQMKSMRADKCNEIRLPQEWSY